MKNIFVTCVLAITMLITMVRAESHTIHFDNK